MNTYEKVMNYLKLHKKLEYDLEFYRNKMTGLKAISYSQEEKGSTSADDTMTFYMQKIEYAEAKMNEIERFIENKFHGPYRTILYKRFIDHETLANVGNSVGYSTSYVKKLIDKAIYGYLAKR